MEDLRTKFITSEGDYREGEVFVFRQGFKAANVISAVMYITALGVYEAELNGDKVGKQMYAPGFTYYRRRLLYQEHDVTQMLKNGENELKVYLGQGWYCGRFLCENKTQIYGEKPGVSWIIKITYEDGRIEKINSCKDVEVLESPYEYAGEYDGEIYHADVKDEVRGYAVEYTEKIPEVLEKTTMEVQLHEKMDIKNVSEFEDKTILDFGQNFAGIIEIDPKYIKDDKITVHHGEILNSDGSLYTNNLRKAKATIVYYKGVDKKVYRPRFTYMGFRYIEISGTEYVPGAISAYAVYTDMKRTGNFECENKLVQKLYENQVWGQKSNYVEVPTDCPQRDERMGYTGDGQVFALTGAYNFDTDDFWKNFFEDLRLGQIDNKEGYVGATVPPVGPDGIGFISMLGWGNAVTIIPEMLYTQFGDEKALIKQYDSMKLFVEAEIRKMGRKNLWIGPSLGDWLAPGKGIAWQAMHNNPVSNSFIVHDLKVITEVAHMLGRKEDESKYAKQLEKTRNAYIKKYVNKNGVVAKDYQSAYIMALKYVIPDGELRRKVLKKYVENVKKHGMQTGFFATEGFLPLLVEAGEKTMAYDMLLHEGCPGWMYQVLRGATTTWERWDALKEDGTVNEEKMATSGENMVSFNHYAFGSVGEFYYQYILGIKPLKPGYEKLHFEPVTDKRLGRVKGTYNSRQGEIKVEWSYKGDELTISLITPVETEVVLPDGRKEEVKAGEYVYHIQNIR